MRCGAKRFIVTYQARNKEKSKEIVARTPQEARRKFRQICGQDIEVKSVRSPK